MIVFNGCNTIGQSSKTEWPRPDKPKHLRVNSISLQSNETFIAIHSGIFLDKKNAKNLLFNIDEMDLYIENLESLVDKMIQYYK